MRKAARTSPCRRTIRELCAAGAAHVPLFAGRPYRDCGERDEPIPHVHVIHGMAGQEAVGEERRDGATVRGYRAGAGLAEVRDARGQARGGCRGGPQDVSDGEHPRGGAVRA